MSQQKNSNDYLPRERANKFGISALSDYELIALLFRTGSKQKDVISCAKEVLGEIGDIKELGNVSAQRLCSIDGVGKSKAYALLAAVEIAKRMQQANTKLIGKKLSTPTSCVEYFYEELKFRHQESLYAIFLTAKNYVISYKEIFRGGLHAISVHPREIFRAAVENSAAAIIVLHNHPSGNTEPSDADFEATKAILNAGNVVGIPLLDHLIIGKNNFYSFREAGYIK
jgi:DNA repair protein radc